MATITTTTVLPAKCAETHHVKNPKPVAAGKALAARNKEKLAQQLKPELNQKREP